MLPLQRLAAGVLRHHVGGDEDVLGANQRGVDEDVGDGGRRGRGCGDERGGAARHTASDDQLTFIHDFLKHEIHQLPKVKLLVSVSPTLKKQQIIDHHY